jgi:uncharacterized membrane protein YcaP (DUF421 family)
MFDLDWHSMFALKGSFLDPVVRGSIMYLGMFILLRIFRRQSGSVGIADLLFIVVIADAAQNGMAGDTKSVTEAGILIGTIIFWDYAIDWLGFRSPILGRILEPDAVILIKDGLVRRKELERQMITEEELKGQLRLQGIGDFSEVKECRLESNGEFSVIKFDSSENEGNKNRGPAVN